MPLLEQSDPLIRFFEAHSEYGYLLPFGALLLCGLGAPLPEEAPLLGAGYLLWMCQSEGVPKVAFLPMVLVCAGAILLGDSLPFWLGRRYGMSVLRLRWVARALHPERFKGFERRFQRHGNWATFACRFTPMLRIPGYFVAGWMGMRYSRMLLLDSLGVLISVPISIFLGKLFAEKVDQLRADFRHFHQILALVVVTLVLILTVKWWRGRRSAREAAAAAPERDPGPGP